MLVAFVAICVYAYTAGRRATLLGQKLVSLKDSHGLVTQDYEQAGDRFEVIQVGRYHSDYVFTFLVRISVANRYRLRMHFFDSIGDEYRTSTHDIRSIETAVRLLPTENKVFVHDAVANTSNQTFFDVKCTDRIYERPGPRISSVISDEPIRIFPILTSLSQPPLGVNRRRWIDRTAIENTCRKHKMRAVWFTIERHSGG